MRAIISYFITLNGKRYYSPEFSTKKEAEDFIQTFIESNKNALKWATGTRYEKRFKKELDKYSRMRVAKYEIRKIETYD